MASRRKGGQRQEQASGEEQQLWDGIFPKLKQLEENEIKAAQNKQKIFTLEANIKEKKKAGIEPSIETLDSLGSLYREGVRIGEASKGIDIKDIMNQVEVLKGMVAHNESERKAPASRASNSRESQNGMEFDGPSDSPVPSPAENKHVRKLGAGRLSSQPPREKDAHKEEKEEREKETSNPGRTKITFAVGDDVAFRPKIAGEAEHDWIQGVVVKVIGEGKSRRYDVKDPFPNEENPNAGDIIYRSSASSMVPIPPADAVLQDYEPGKRVLALYPTTSTFYRAEVKAMVDSGAKVRLQFEEESLEALKDVDRQFVLDHRG